MFRLTPLFSTSRVFKSYLHAKVPKQSRPHQSTRNRNNDKGPLANFFARYTYFNYDPTKSATAEFNRLCGSNDWKRHSDERKEAKMGFQDALTMQFNFNFGTDVNDLTNWQALCARLQMDPVPESLNKCRKVRGNA